MFYKIITVLFHKIIKKSASIVGSLNIRQLVFSIFLLRHSQLLAFVLRSACHGHQVAAAALSITLIQQNPDWKKNNLALCPLPSVFPSNKIHCVFLTHFSMKAPYLKKIFIVSSTT